jgi:hypothetical protein
MPTPSVIQIDFLRKNNWSAFYNSLLSWFERKGELSDKQIAAIDKAMAPKPIPAAPVFSINAGSLIEVKPWIAHRLQADLNMEYFFRNLEVVEILKESEKAFHVSVKFISKIVTNCHICGKDLDTDISRATGIGPVCAKKIGLPRPTLENATEILALIDALVAKIGTVGPIWIPKSQIKEITVIRGSV